MGVGVGGVMEVGVGFWGLDGWGYGGPGGGLVYLEACGRRGGADGQGLLLRLRQGLLGGAGAGGVGALPVGLQVVGHVLAGILQLVLVQDDVKHLLEPGAARRR